MSACVLEAKWRQTLLADPVAVLEEFWFEHKLSRKDRDGFISEAFVQGSCLTSFCLPGSSLTWRVW